MRCKLLVRTKHYGAHLVDELVGIEVLEEEAHLLDTLFRTSVAHELFVCSERLE